MGGLKADPSERKWARLPPLLSESLPGPRGPQNWSGLGGPGARETLHTRKRARPPLPLLEGFPDSRCHPTFIREAILVFSGGGCAAESCRIVIWVASMARHTSFAAVLAEINKDFDFEQVCGLQAAAPDLQGCARPVSIQ